MRIAFDLDGTLYDSLSIILDLDNEIRLEMGYDELSKEEYVSKFQSKDWIRLCRDFGIREEQIDDFNKEFVRRFEDYRIPDLIPGAYDMVNMVEDCIGIDNISIISNEIPSRVKKRFIRDGLERYLDRVESPFQGKAKELYSLAKKDGSSGLYYIGDLVSDGEDCKEARNNGALNLSFYGIIHPYAMNAESAMRSFVKKNKDFSDILENLSDIEHILR